MRSLYRTLLDVIRTPAGHEGDSAQARWFLWTIKKYAPPEIAAVIDPALWQAAMRAALEEADRQDAEWKAADAEVWRERWPAIHDVLKRDGARVRRSGAPETFRVYFPPPGRVWFCTVSLARAEVRIGYGYGNDYVSTDLDRLPAVFVRATEERSRHLAAKARFRALRKTHRYVAKGRSGWVAKDGAGPTFQQGVTLAEYEVEMRRARLKLV